jgi:hypothetical protein
MSMETRIVFSGIGEIPLSTPLSLSGQRLDFIDFIYSQQSLATAPERTAMPFASAALTVQGGAATAFAQGQSSLGVQGAGTTICQVNSSDLSVVDIADLSVGNTFLVNYVSPVSWNFQIAPSFSATSLGRETANLALRAESLFTSAYLVDFEDGFENTFTRRLIQFVAINGVPAVEEIARLLFASRIHSETAAHTLLCLARIEDRTTYYARSVVLQRGLSSSSADVRDAASVGIASMNDPNAIPSLERAAARETIQDLKLDMEKVISELKRAT